MLLKAGADVNVGDKNGYNALHHLAAPAFIYDKKYLKCAKKLLKAGPWGGVWSWERCLAPGGCLVRGVSGPRGVWSEGG